MLLLCSILIGCITDSDRYSPFHYHDTSFIILSTNIEYINVINKYKDLKSE